MRTLTLVAGLASAMLPLAAAEAAVMTVGGPLSTTCYRAALGQDASEAAIDGCTRSLAEEPLSAHDRAGTLVNRGILQMIRHRDTLADADFDAAIQAEQGLADAYLNKGFLRLRNGDGRAALPLLQSGIDRGARRQALAIFARGVAYEQMGDFSAAYADLRRAQQLEPRWAMPAEYLASYQVK